MAPPLSENFVGERSAVPSELMMAPPSRSEMFENRTGNRRV